RHPRSTARCAQSAGSPRTPTSPSSSPGSATSPTNRARPLSCPAIPPHRPPSSRKSKPSDSRRRSQRGARPSSSRREAFWPSQKRDLRTGQLTGESARVVIDPLAGKPVRARIPRKVDHDVELGGPADRGLTLPCAALRPAHRRDLDDALRADDNVLQVEPHVGKGVQEARVEGARTGVAFPALAGGDDLVHAVSGQRRDEARKVATVFRFRMIDPETSDLRVE